MLVAEDHGKGILGILGIEAAPLPVHDPRQRGAVHHDVAGREVPVRQDKPLASVKVVGRSLGVPPGILVGLAGILPHVPEGEPPPQPRQGLRGDVAEAPPVELLLRGKRAAGGVLRAVEHVAGGLPVHAADVGLRDLAHAGELGAELVLDVLLLVLVVVVPDVREGHPGDALADHGAGDGLVDDDVVEGEHLGRQDIVGGRVVHHVGLGRVHGVGRLDLDGHGGARGRDVLDDPVAVEAVELLAVGGVGIRESTELLVHGPVHVQV